MREEDVEGMWRDLQTRAESRKRTKHGKGLCSLLPSRGHCDEGEGQSVHHPDKEVGLWASNSCSLTNARPSTGPVPRNLVRYDAWPGQIRSSRAEKNRAKTDVKKGLHRNASRQKAFTRAGDRGRGLRLRGGPDEVLNSA